MDEATLMREADEFYRRLAKMMKEFADERPDMTMHELKLIVMASYAGLAIATKKAEDIARDLGKN